MQSDERVSRSSHLLCILCETADETDTTGPLQFKKDIAAHQNCLLFASGIYCKYSPIFDDLFGFDVEDVKNEYKRGKKLRCSFCKKNGATAGCEVSSCKRCYHYPCAKEANAVLHEDNFRLYCQKHSSHGSIAGSKKGHAKVLANSGHKGSETTKPDNSHSGSEPNSNPALSPPEPASPPEPSCSVTSSSPKLKSPSFVLLFPLSDSETPRSSQKRKRKISSDSDDTRTTIDSLCAPIESELEDNTPPKQNNQQTLDSDNESGDNQEPRQEDAPVPGGVENDECEDSDFESQSLLLPEYRQENVPFTVIADSGPSIESVAETSPGRCSPAAPGTAATALSNLDQSVSVPKKAKYFQPNITIPSNPHVSARPSLDSPPFSDASETSPFKVVSWGNPLFKIEHCASPDKPPLTMDTNKIPGSQVAQPRDHPLDLTAPEGCCMAHVKYAEPVGHVGVSDTSAAIFWRRCNEVGCTETIFNELIRQITSLSEKVQNQHATQHDYAMSLRILEASGKLPTIFRQMEQDLEDQERQLQKKREALRDAKAVLDENQHI